MNCFKVEKCFYGQTSPNLTILFFLILFMGPYSITHAYNPIYKLYFLSFSRPVLVWIVWKRGSPICERVHKKIYSLRNTLKTTFLNVKLQRLCKSHHLQCITSSKSVIDITKWAQEYFQKTTVGKHNPPCHLQMATKSSIMQKGSHIWTWSRSAVVCCGQGSFKMDCFKVEKCSTVRRVQVDILVGNHGRCVLRAKEEGDLPACYQRSVHKPASLMVWGCISAYSMGSLHVLEGTMNAWKVYKGFRATYAPLQMTSIQEEQCKTTYCSYYNSMGFV